MSSMGTRSSRWEKGAAPVALFSVGDSSTKMLWSEREYLGVYQCIVWGKIKDEIEKPGWIVFDHTKKIATHLQRWIVGYWKNEI